MTDCKYCGQDGANQTTFEHPECLQEGYRRRDSGSCVKCDERPISRSGLLCDTCDFDFPYHGYPGGSP